MYNVRREWTLREIDLTKEVSVSRKELAAWIAYSLGFSVGKKSLAPIIILSLFEKSVGGRCPSFEEIYEAVVRYVAAEGGVPPTEEAVRYHVRKLVGMGLLYKSGKRLCFNTDPSSPDKLETAVDAMFERMEGARRALKEAFYYLSRLARL